MRRQSQLESEPCEAGRSNPSRRQGATGSRTEREARQGNELLASSSWCAEGAGQTQRWVSSVREHAEGRYAQTSAGCIGGERHRSQCAHSYEFDVLEFDEYTEELLEVSRQVELDFMSRLGVHRKRPRTRATDSGILAIPTRWLDVSKECVKQPKYRW